MENSPQLNLSNKKRKAQEKAKLFIEFQGLNSLNEESVNADKRIKLEMPVEATSQQPNPHSDKIHPPRKNYILLDNIDSSISREELTNYLVENGIDVSKVCLVQGPLAITSFNREKDVDCLYNKCQGIYYKANELLILRSSMKRTIDNHGSTNMSNVSVHLKNLNESTTIDNINDLISDPSTIQNISINSERATAVIDFVDKQSAQDCIDKLDNTVIGGNLVKASFLVITQRPDRFCLNVFDLPYGFNKVDMKETFPTASRIKILKGLTRYCQVYFKTAEDLDNVQYSGVDFYVKGALVRLESIAAKSKKAEKPANFVLNIYNMPFDTTLPEIRELYPKVRFVEMLKNPDGMFVGSAKLNFEDKEMCEEALKSTKGLTLKHRKIRAEMKFDHVVATEADAEDQ